MSDNSVACRRPLVCILVGQSDMVGRGIIDELPDSLVEAVRCCDWRYLYVIDRGSREGAESRSDGFMPLTRTSQYSEAGERHSFGPEWGLAEQLTIVQAGDGGFDRSRPVFIIKFASGSTSLGKDWVPGGELFKGLVELVQKGTRVIAREFCGAACDEEIQMESSRILREDTVFFWLQGHSDASGNAEMRKGYKDSFIEFVLSIRKALIPQDLSVAPAPHALNFPFVASELDWLLDERSKSSVRFAKRLKEINRSIEEACEILKARSPSIPCIFASFPRCEDWSLTYHADGHCDSNGLLLLGKNIAFHALPSICDAQKRINEA